MQAGEHSYEMIYINVETGALLCTLKQNIQAINELRNGCLKEFSCFVRKITELHSKMMADLDGSEAFLRHSMKILIESPIKQVEHNWNAIKKYNIYVWKYIPEAFSLKSVFMAAEKHYDQKFIGYFVVEKALMVSKERFNQELDNLTEVYLTRTRNVDRVVKEAVEVDEPFEVEEKQVKVKEFSKSQDFCFEPTKNEGIFSTIFQAVAMSDDFKGELSFQAKKDYQITEANITGTWESFLSPIISKPTISQDSKSVTSSFTASIPHKRFWAITITLNLTGQMTKSKTLKKTVSKKSIKSITKKIKESVPLYQNKEEAKKAAEFFLLSKYT